jgi:DNA ligase D
MANGSPLNVTVDGQVIRVTSPDKPFFPGVSKRDVVEYYIAVGGLMIEHLCNRPTALERWPDGVFDGHDSFYQKHMPKTVPPFVQGCDIRFPSGRPGRLLMPTSPAVIAWAVQMSTVTFHPWPSAAPATDLPDQLRLDFDPAPGTGFTDAVRAACIAREVLDLWSWPSYPKTSGGRGIHVYVPIIAGNSFIDVRHAAIAIGREIERRDPDLVTMSWWKEERGPRVFIDFNQNAQDRTMASAFSLRANAQATVSMPLTWPELLDCSPMDFTIATVPEIISRGSWSDPWSTMAKRAVDLAPALEAWERDVDGGLPELPYPPDFPKMPGEPPRVQPSRKRQG